MKSSILIKILELVKKAREIKSGNKDFVDYDKLTKREIKTLNNLLNYDFNGYKRTLDISGIKHSINKHPNLNDADFLLIPFIVKNYDFISIGKKDNAIVYKKTLGNEFFYIEEIRKGRKKLVIKTFYKRQKHKK